MQLTGDSYENIDHAGPGYIIALSGLQTTRTGDILGPPVSSNISETDDGGLEGDMDIAFVPHPVVHAALEPRSSSAFRNLERALACMQREDPSFKVTIGSFLAGRCIWFWNSYASTVLLITLFFECFIKGDHRLGDGAVGNCRNGRSSSGSGAISSASGVQVGSDHGSTSDLSQGDAPSWK